MAQRHGVTQGGSFINRSAITYVGEIRINASRHVDFVFAIQFVLAVDVTFGVQK